MIDTQWLKTFGEGLMSRSKTNLTVDGAIPPQLIVLKNGGDDVETIDLPMENEEDMNEVGNILTRKAGDSEVDAMAFLIEARVRELDKGESVPESLKEDEQSSEAIYLAIYRKEGTLIRHALFSKDEQGTPAFMDLDWEELTGDQGRMSNPWLAAKK
jgi:hypothetical protein